MPTSGSTKSAMPKAPPTARQALDASMTEAQLQATVLQMAAATGWTPVFTDAPAKKCHNCGTYVKAIKKAGHPDIEIVRGPVLRYLELKRQVNYSVTDEQREIVGRLQGVREVTAGIYRPSDLDAIEELLR